MRAGIRSRCAWTALVRACLSAKGAPTSQPRAAPWVQCLRRDKALKGRHTLSRPFRALSMGRGFPRASPWAGLWPGLWP